MNSFRLRKAFTLIELLVVISIIALLSSVVLSSLNSARDKARQSAVRLELRQLAMILGGEFAQRGSYLGVTDSGISLTGSQTGGALISSQCASLTTESENICLSLFNRLSRVAATDRTAVLMTINPRGFMVGASVDNATLDGNSLYFCMDSKGNSRYVSANATTGLAAGSNTRNLWQLQGCSGSETINP